MAIRVFKSLCSDIENLSLKILNLSEQQIKHKAELEEVIYNGYDNIAKARYVMGTKFLSTTKLTENVNIDIKPLSTVSREKCKNKNHYVFKLLLRKPSSPLAEYNSLSSKYKEESQKKSIVDSLDTTTAIIVPDNIFQELKDEYYEEASWLHIYEYSDPIKSFGSLVPSTLRIAQKLFNDSLIIILKCATIQSNLSVAIERYEYLLEIKDLMEKAAVLRSINLSSVVELETMESEMSGLRNEDEEIDAAESDHGFLMAEDEGAELEKMEDVLFGE